jgi:CRP-like cAMP-binding protein
MMQPVDSYHEHLRRVPLFADFDRHDFAHLDPIATELQLAAGQALFTEGSLARDMVVVLDGVLEVTRHGDHVADIGAGGFAGEMALLTGQPRNSTVTAKTDVTVLHIDGRGFADLLESVPQLAVKMLPVVARRVVAAD